MMGFPSMYTGELLQAFAVRFANVQVIHHLSMQGMPRTMEAEAFVSRYTDHFFTGRAVLTPEILPVVLAALTRGQRQYRVSLHATLLVCLHRDTSSLVYEYVLNEKATDEFEADALRVRGHRIILSDDGYDDIEEDPIPGLFDN